MNYISAKDFSSKQIEELFTLSDSMKGKIMPVLGTRKPILVLIFEKASTRTRVSFEAAMDQLGGSAIYIDAANSQISRGESMSDTARVLSSYVDILAARMHRHSEMEELAKYSSIPVINALTDLEHPCQALSDVYTIRESFGKVSGLRIAFVGDIADNVANSLMIVAAKLGAEISLVGPEEYDPDMGFVKAARKFGKVEIHNDMKMGLEGCDVVYTDTFISMGQEAEAEKRRKLFARYKLNSSVMKYAKKDAKVMHCLPAHRGEEITSELLDGKSSLVWRQAANKLPVEKAILLYLLEQQN
jgi:ornithine carbamoyltransferase